MINRNQKIAAGAAIAVVAAVSGGLYNASHHHHHKPTPKPPVPSPSPVTPPPSPVPVPSPGPHKDGLPNAALTPGETDPAVTQANIHQTICVPGYSSRVRPPVSVTDAIKTERMAAYGIPVNQKAAYELDHLIPLSLGGAPRSDLNLWPELRTGPEGANVKDKYEFAIYKAVCADKIPLADAQKATATDWEAANTKFFPTG